MTVDNDPLSEPPIFSAVLTPHRSLSAGGFAVLMGAVIAVSFAAGLVFMLAGAWPVFGFFGLDVLLIYWAFRASYRAGAAYEQVVVTPTTVTVRKVDSRGAAGEWTLNPFWVRLERDEDTDYGLQRLSLVSHGRALTIAGFLAPSERESFAGALAGALAQARRGGPRGP
jgi:uncharacterized membrane protein